MGFCSEYWFIHCYDIHFSYPDHLKNMYQKSSLHEICTHFCVTVLWPQRTYFVLVLQNGEQCWRSNSMPSSYFTLWQPYSCIISHSLINSKHFHFIVIIRPKHCFNCSNSKHDHTEMFHSCTQSKWHNKTATSYTQKTDHRTLCYEHFLLAESCRV